MKWYGSKTEGGYGVVKVRYMERLREMSEDFVRERKTERGRQRVGEGGRGRDCGRYDTSQRVRDREKVRNRDRE